MQTRRKAVFTTIRTEGGLLPADLLQSIVSAQKGMAGLTPESYHLAPGERINEAVSRSWNRLLGLWEAFRAAAEKLPADDPGTSVTRERWLLPLFQELGYGRLRTAGAIEIDGRSYAVSHAWERTPIHLVGCMVELDRPTKGVAGAARSSPHSLMQELLNRSEKHLWGFVSNGRRLRILRDNKSLTRQSYVEFDLEAMLEGEVYADFTLLWLLCHQSRVEADRPEECWLERWSQTAQEQGTRALDQLRVGVEEAISALGSGFLRHPANRDLRESLRSGSLSTQEYYRLLLRLVYRLLFLFVAEDRELLLDPDASQEARERYLRHYATTRLRRLAERYRGTRHADLYHGLRLVMNRLYAGCPELGLPALGSFLWSEKAIGSLKDCEIANADLLTAIRALAFTWDGSLRRPVDYRNLRSEELGSVYEALLELHPELSVDAGTFSLKTSGGSERKTTGSYYTPDSLVQCLLDTALDPALDAAVKKPNPEQAILDLKVCDPACGSGHFLIAAAHRMAKRLASVRTGDEEPSPEATRTALRDIIGRCVYGVDINPMAVELCKVALWMEALEPGKPLSFLDHHIQCGNSLLGVTMEALEPGKPLSFLDHHIQCGNSLLGVTHELLDQGIPDGAFEPIEGDDKAVCAETRKRNREERSGQEALFDPNLQPWEQLGNLPQAVSRLQQIPDDTLQGVQERERLYVELVLSAPYENCRLLADAWCAAFVWKKRREGDRYSLTTTHLRRILRNPHSLEPWMREEIRRLAAQYRFFHWHLAFPDVFLPGSGKDAGVPGFEGAAGQDDAKAIAVQSDPKASAKGHTARHPAAPRSPLPALSGGFDVVLGNPPWERVKLQEKEWFAVRRPDIACAPNAAQRQKLIAALKEEDPALYQAFLEDRRQSEGESHLLRRSGRFPLCGRGDVNTYAVFAELFRSLLSPSGRAGVIVPTGIATDDTTKAFFADLIETGSLVSLYDFENRRTFPNVHASYKFSLLTLRAPALQHPSSPAEFVFFAHSTDDLRDPERRFTLTAPEISLLNPNTKTCPVFRSRRDAEITKGIYRRVPVLINETEKRNPWGIEFMRMLDMANDSGLFHSEPAPERLPLYEAKMLHHFNHRWATYGGSGARKAENGDPLDPPAGEPEVRDTTPAERQNPRFTVTPRYHVDADEVEERLTKRDRQGSITWEWRRGWLLGWRDITNTTNERTVIASLLPRVGVGNNFPLMFPSNDSPLAAACLVANLSAFVLDYVARQKVGGTHLNYFIYKQLPVLPPSAYKEWGEWIAPRVLELVYTAYDMAPFAQDCGFNGEPFLWNEDRRFLLRCELDALYFRLYGIARDDVDYIMETFPIVKRKDEQMFGEYRTKRVILEIYDAMAAGNFQTRLDPPPAGGWTPTEEQIREAFAMVSPEAADPGKPPAPALAEPEELTLVSPAAAPEPLRDRNGEIVRVRVYSAASEMLVRRGVVTGRKKRGDVTIWSVLADGETTPRQFESPPHVLKRLKPHA